MFFRSDNFHFFKILKNIDFRSISLGYCFFGGLLVHGLAIVQNTARIDIFQNFEKFENVLKKHRFLPYFGLKLFQTLKGASAASTLLNLVHQNLLYVNIWPLSRQFLTDAL